MDVTEWPSLVLRLQHLPPADRWEVFCAMALLEIGYVGIDEGYAAAEASDSAPREVRFVLPRETTEPELTAAAARLGALAERAFGSGSATAAAEFLPATDWNAEWRRHFRLLRAGARTFVGPPWDAQLPPDAPPDAFVVRIDPGMAFGTGTHETTRLCLRILEDQVGPDTVLLDVGAGSGILGFAALRLGARAVLAMEIDPEAEENFRLNAELNGAEDRLTLVVTGEVPEALNEGKSRDFPAHNLMVCNMLRERFEPLGKALRLCGVRLILSGFLLGEADIVTSFLKETGFNVEERYECNEWGAFVCVPA